MSLKQSTKYIKYNYMLLSRHSANSAAFSLYAKPKLKFDLGTGTDVELPTPNPATQYLPNVPDYKGCNPVYNSLSSSPKEAPSTARAADYPSVSTLLQGMPTNNPEVPRAPQPSSGASVSLVDAGRNIPEKSRALGTGPADTRKTLDTRAIAKSKVYKGEGLIVNKSSKSLYRSILGI